MAAADGSLQQRLQTYKVRLSSTAPIPGLALSAGLLSGCTALGDYSGDTCAGEKPVTSLEEASSSLVTAVYAGDLDGVCRVTAAPVDGQPLSDQMVTATKVILQEQGITPDDLKITVGEQLGSSILVTLSDGSADRAHSLELIGTVVRAEGFTIGLPPQVYSGRPSHPASQSASVTD
ncbi:hypothetical protein [Glutamicibacter sp.]|uniref:hypothetical protein n=1 Tax=Glutamicibacter sp. TaxID=1931995 RepID=UPI002B4A0D5D|nr:hypothetical protein [Glutamicibacter sp.]HJX77447.1 hypothetical protein [Glutamicibacter sp.]